MVKWSGIQHALEEAESDILLLFDCCSSGTANTDVGNGVTELIAACGFNGSANPVGLDSFTNTLITELRLLSGMPSFTVGVLYNKILCRIQSKMPAGREIQKSPLHVVLSQNRRLPKGIQLSPKREIRNQAGNERSLGPSGNSELSQHLSASSSSSRMSPPNHPSVPSGLSPSSPSGSHGSLNQHTTSSSISSLFSDIEQFPRIALTIRLKESLAASEVSADLLADWMRMMPVLAENVKVEAGFASLSTLLIISLPVAIWCYVPDHPALSVIGVIKSTNFLPRSPVLSAQATSSAEKIVATTDITKGSTELPIIISQDVLDVKKPISFATGLEVPSHFESRKLQMKVRSHGNNRDSGFSGSRDPSPVRMSDSLENQPHKRHYSPYNDHKALDVANARIIELEDKLDDLKGLHDSRDQTLSAVNEELNVADSRIKQLEARIDELNGQLAGYKRENEQLTRGKNDMPNRVDDRMIDLEDEKDLARRLRQGEGSEPNKTERPSSRGPLQGSTALRQGAYSHSRIMALAARPPANPFTPFSLMSGREAETMNRQKLKLSEEVLGKTHPSTLTTMSNLAGVLSSQGKYAEAETMNRQTLELSEEVLGKTHPSTLTTMSNLAGILSSQGKYAEAETMDRQTLELSEEVLGKTHPETLTTMSNLARVLSS